MLANIWELVLHSIKLTREKIRSDGTEVAGIFNVALKAKYKEGYDEEISYHHLKFLNLFFSSPDKYNEFLYLWTSTLIVSTVCWLTLTGLTSSVWITSKNDLFLFEDIIEACSSCVCPYVGGNSCWLSVSSCFLILSHIYIVNICNQVCICLFFI